MSFYTKTIQSFTFSPKWYLSDSWSFPFYFSLSGYWTSVFFFHTFSPLQTKRWWNIFFLHIWESTAQQNLLPACDPAFTSVLKGTQSTLKQILCLQCLLPGVPLGNSLLALRALLMPDRNHLSDLSLQLSETLEFPWPVGLPGTTYYVVIFGSSWTR